MPSLSTTTKPPPVQPFPLHRKTVANILQNHYVERLGRAFVVNVPWFINAFFTALTPFLDPITKDKIRFNAT